MDDLCNMTLQQALILFAEGAAINHKMIILSAMFRSFSSRKFVLDSKMIYITLNEDFLFELQILNFKGVW